MSQSTPAIWHNILDNSKSFKHFLNIILHTKNRYIIKPTTTEIDDIIKLAIKHGVFKENDPETIDLLLKL
jgi:hypothetical protein